MSVVADLETLKRMVGATSSRDDDLLGWALESATSYTTDRVMVDDVDDAEVQEAILLMAARLYKRRLSPEGVAGWGELGVVRIVARDPDIAQLLEHHLDMAKAGIA